MGYRTVCVAAATAMVMLGAAGTAEAFDVVPTGCLARPEAVDSTGAPSAVAVFGYDNPNPATVTVDFGPDNIVLQPPNFRHGQPTDFAPGRHEPAWMTLINPSLQPQLDWVLQGADASPTQTTCSGEPDAQPLSLPALGDGGSTAAVGDSLPVSPGTFSDSSALVSPVVERCAGDACTPVTDIGSAVTSYTVSAGDAGYTLRVRSVALTMDGWASALSAPVAVSGPATGPAPQNPPADATATAPEPIQEPAIIGSPGVGLPLTADPGTWSGSPAPGLAVRWQRCDATTCSDIPGASADSYRPAAADIGDRIRSVVTASATLSGATGGASPVVSETAASAPTPPVTAGPGVTAAPIIAGAPDVGARLVLTGPGGYTQPVATTVQWQACGAGGCTDRAGATGDSYLVTAADAGLDLRAVVTATAAGGQTVVASNQLGPAGAVRAGNPPRVMGGPATGGLVWADGGSWIAQPAPALTFQWLRCNEQGDACSTIAGATGPGYAPAAFDLGHTLRVAVTATNGFSQATATSPASAPVARAASAAASSAPPVLGHLRARPRRFRVGRPVTTLRPVHGVRPRRGTVIAVRLTARAWVRVDVEQRRHHRLRALATLTRTVAPGTTWLSFTGRLPARWGGALRPGTYLLRIQAFGATGRGSRVRELRLRVLR